MRSKLYFGIYDILDSHAWFWTRARGRVEGAHYINLEVVGS